MPPIFPIFVKIKNERMKKIALLFAAGILITACTETKEEPATPPTKDEVMLDYLSEKGWKGVKDASGMYVVTDYAGAGEERPTLDDEVTIFYQGYLLDGTHFDGTGPEPATFPLFQLIEGWQIGIPYFGKGGKGKLVIPSELAYGDRTAGEIPGGSTLMFEIELIDWAPAGGTIPDEEFPIEEIPSE